MRPLNRSCFLPFPLGRLSLLALPHLLGTCLPSLWRAPFPLHAPNPIPLSSQGAALAHLDTLLHHDLVLWTDGWAFFLTKAALTYLSTAHSLALKPLFSFEQVQYAPVFPLTPAPLCMLFAGVGSTNQLATSFLLHYDSLSVLATFFLLYLSGKSGRTCLLFPLVLSGYNGSPDTRFSRE